MTGCRLVLVAVLAFVAFAWSISNASAACSVTNNLMNGAPANATEVNRNFSDLTGCAAPQASPTFSGTVTMPDGSTWGTGGYGGGNGQTVTCSLVYNTSGPVSISLPDSTGGEVTVTSLQSGVGRSTWLIPYNKQGSSAAIGTAQKAILTADPITGASVSGANLQLNLFAANTNLSWCVHAVNF